MPKALLVAPEQPITFWSFNESLRLIGKKCAFPPLGLLTVAAMIPERYELRLTDLNVETLSDADLDWADCVITSSMIIHWKSLEEVIARANGKGVPILCGGPLPTQYHEEIEGDAVFYLGEAENGFVDIVDRLVEEGVSSRRSIDRRGEFQTLEATPVPRWDLIEGRHYQDLMVQITRGCPESCTFCNIPALYGRKTRLKEPSQTIRELQAIYDMGWRGSIMAVDDNFIGNRDSIVRVLREEVIPWQKERDYPFQFYTQASVRMAEDPELLDAMHEAGFDHVFCGIETPVKESLKFMAAQKNLKGNLPLLEKVKTLQRAGLEVSAGFIVGLDTDPEDVAERMIDFIQEAAIPISMVGILGVLRDTPDYRRFEKMGRLRKGVRYSGDSGLFRKQLSFVPVIDEEELFRRHEQIVSTIYTPRYYFERVRRMVLRIGRETKSPRPIRAREVWGALRALWIQGVRSRGRLEYWKTMAAVAIRRPRRIPLVMRMAVEGHHMLTVTEQALQVARIEHFYDEALEFFERLVRGVRSAGGRLRPKMPPMPSIVGSGQLASVGERLRSAAAHASPGHAADALIQAARHQIGHLRKGYRGQALGSLGEFHRRLEEVMEKYGVPPVGALRDTSE